MIGNLEEYVKKVLKIPHCNFEGIDPRIAYEIVVGLSLMYEMYPFFNRVICAIGGVEDIEAHENMVAYSDNWTYRNLENIGNIDYLNEEEDENSSYCFCRAVSNNNPYEYKLSKIPNKDNLDYFSLIIYNSFKNCDFSKFDIKSSPWGREAIYHEFGHLLDTFLHISNSKKIKEIITGHDIEKEICKLEESFKTL